jgi:hypothetical protein
VRINDLSSFSGNVTGESLSGDVVRTLQLSPDFADTHARRTVARRLISSAQISTDLPSMPWPQRLLLGTDISIGDLSSEYRPLVTGDVSAYAAPGITAGDVDASVAEVAMQRPLFFIGKISSPHGFVSSPADAWIGFAMSTGPSFRLECRVCALSVDRSVQNWD